MRRYIAPMFILASLAPAWAHADTPRAVTTFHNAGLYWSPDGGAADRDVSVRFREKDGGAWRDGLPMRYLPIDGTDLDEADYRGSIVGLRSGVTYVVELGLEGTSEAETLELTTWPEAFPEGEVIDVQPSGSTLRITESGTPDAYRVYDGGGRVFETDGNYNINVLAKYVILRNFTLRGADVHAIRLGDGTSDVVIEDCDISGWGGPGATPGFAANAHAAIHSNVRELTRVVVQRNIIHHPNHDTNNWTEESCRTPDSCSFHPSGPQAVGLYNSSGNHVIRYNRVFSDADHYYNDIMGGGDNASFRGYPGPDSDLYGNHISHCWDDGMELEGGVRNVRVYANYIDECFQAIGNAPVAIGPLYVWRNVVGRSARAPGEGRGNFLKMGFAMGVEWMRGFQYVFHNTLTDRDGRGFEGYGGSSRVIRHVISRNNVLLVPTASNVFAESTRHENNDLDHDLYSEAIAAGLQPNGTQARPVFAAGTFDDATSVADYRLAPGSPGKDAALPIPNFNDVFEGAGPDHGAFEDATMRFGPMAELEPPPPVEPECLDDEICGNGEDDDCDDLVDEECEVTCDALTIGRGGPSDGTAASFTGGTPLTIAAPGGHAEATVAWDDEGLHVRYEVEDEDVRGHVPSGETGEVWKDDGVELFVDPEGDGGEWGDTDRQIIATARGALFVANLADPDTVRVTTSLDATLDDEAPDRGYTILITVPWSTLGVSDPEQGRAFGLDLVVNDRERPDDGTADGATRTSTDLAGLTSFRDPEGWCSATLTGESTAPGEDAGSGGGEDAGAPPADDAGAPDTPDTGRRGTTEGESEGCGVARQRTPTPMGLALAWILGVIAWRRAGRRRER